jgi:acetyltransferase
MNPCLDAPAASALPPPATALRPSPVLIRPIVPADATLLGEFVRSLSPASRRRRFHAGVRELPSRLLQRYAQLDCRNEMAFVASVEEAGRERLVGEARYAAADGPADTREFALAVHDERQRRGLGAELLERLLQHAHLAGVRWLHGDVLRDNEPMLALARKLGFGVQRHPDDARLLRVVRATASGTLQ